MAAVFRLCVLFLVFLIGACASREEAKREAGLPHEEESKIPEGSPGTGIEKIQKRPDSTPTPRPTSAMDKPLDPTGF